MVDAGDVHSAKLVEVAELRHFRYDRAHPREELYVKRLDSEQ
jgi:hypothetical protein